MGPWAFAASVISIVVGAGIFAVPAELAASAGVYAPLAFLACGIAIGAVALCFAEGGSRIPTSGGIYGVIEVALGPLAAHVSGILLCVCCVLACGAVAAALADVVATIFPVGSRATVRSVTIVSVLGGIAAVNIAGVSQGGRLVAATTLLKMIPLAIFIVAGLGAIHGSNFVSPMPPNAPGFSRALILAVFALVGMEAALCASGEVVQPNRTLPRALIIAVASTTSLYILIQIIAQGILGSALATSKAPLADAMAHIHPALRALMLAGTALSMLGWLSSDILGSPRQLFAFARDGLLPRFLGSIDPRSRAPHAAILCYCLTAMTLALTGSFSELVVLSTLATAALYIAGCAAAWTAARRNIALAGPPLNFRFLTPVAILAISSMLFLIAMGSRREIVGLATLITVSIGVHFIQLRVRRHAGAKV